MANWSNLNISNLLPGQSVVSFLQSAVDALQLVSDASSLILSTITGQVLPDTDPLVIAFQAAVSVLISTIQSLLADTSDTQVSALFAVPTRPEEMPLYAKGFQGWTETVAGSFFDAGDVGRPQTSSSGIAGALLLAVTAPDAAAFQDAVHSLLRFFGRISRMQTPAPVSFRALLADVNGDPILDPITILSGASQAVNVRLEWEEPTFSGNNLNLFEGRRIYVERARTRAGNPVPAPALVPASARDSRNQRPPSDFIEPQRDREGSPLFEWEPLNPAIPAESFFARAIPLVQEGYELDWIAGRYYLVLRNLQTGSDNGYYYRIRMVPQGVQAIQQSGSWQLFRNGAPYDGSMPSIPAIATLPNPLPNFDFTNAFLNIYRIAHILRFDTAIQQTNGLVLAGVNLLDAIPNVILSGTSFDNYSQAPDTRYLTDPMLPEPITFDAARVAARDPATLVLTRLDPFAGQDEMYAALFDQGGGEALRTLSDRRALDFLERASQQILAQDAVRNLFQTRYQTLQARIDSILENGANDSDFGDQGFRSSIAFILGLVRGLAASGRPPDWIGFKLFADGFPEINTYLDLFLQLTNSLQALSSTPSSLISAGQSALQQRLAFISSILDQIDSIIQFFAALNQTISLLWIPPSVGGVERIVTEILTATNEPPTTANTFTGGVVLYLSGPNINAAASALSLIFGV